MAVGQHVHKAIKRRLAVDTWTETDDSSANSALTVTHAAESGKAHYVTHLTVSFQGGAPANEVAVELKDGSTTVWVLEVAASAGADGIDVNFDPAIKITDGNKAELAVEAAGMSIVARGNLVGFTI